MKDFFFLNRYRSQLTVDLISKGFWKWSKKLPFDCLEKNLEHVAKRSTKNFQDWKFKKYKTEKNEKWGSTQSLFSSVGWESLFSKLLWSEEQFYGSSQLLWASIYCVLRTVLIHCFTEQKSDPRSRLSSLQSNCTVWKLENGQSFNRLYSQK